MFELRTSRTLRIFMRRVFDIHWKTKRKEGRTLTRLLRRRVSAASVPRVVSHPSLSLPHSTADSIIGVLVLINRAGRDPLIIYCSCFLSLLHNFDLIRIKPHEHRPGAPRRRRHTGIESVPIFVECVLLSLLHCE